MHLLSSAVFQNQRFKKISFENNITGCQMVWIAIKFDIMSIITWVQTVFKGYHMTTKVDTSKDRVNLLILNILT